MQKFNDLLRYEQYLLPKSKIGIWQGGNAVDGIIQVPFFHYEPKIVEFMDFFQTSEYADHGYSHYLRLYRLSLFRPSFRRESGYEPLFCMVSF